MDIRGDETTYIAYHASRYEFNQVVLSKTLLSDHAIPPLVNILRSLNLDDTHEVNVFHSNGDAVENDEEEEVRMFICCSSPHGKFPYLLTLFCLVACIFSITSNGVCNYVDRTTTVRESDGTTSPGLGLSVGLYGYTLKQCKDPYGTCDESNPEDLVDSKYCQTYPTTIHPDSYWTAARTVSILSVMLGFAGLALVSISTCTKLKRKTWTIACAIFLLTTLFQGLQFLFLKGDLCNEWTHPDNEYVAFGECSLSTGGYLGIASTIFWFVSAVGCSRMARQL